MNSNDPYFSIQPTGIDINSLLEKRINIRINRWGHDFDKNYKEFAEGLAQGIFDAALADFISVIESPYLKLPDSKEPCRKFVNLNITNNKAVTEIKTLAKNRLHLSPFNEWLEHFSQAADSDEKKHFFNRYRLEERSYFKSAMELVEKSVTKELDELFKQIVSIPANSSIKFKMVPSNRRDESSSFSSGIEGIELNLWLEKSDKSHSERPLFIGSELQRQIEKANERKLKHKQLKRIMFCTAAILIGLVAVLVNFNVTQFQIKHDK
ncbi:MAG: hypothetical protein K0S74_1122 [Chlamydiales bacterium]|jgi:hypothetical protein|nr:hypothetical protein [Chlamydiales bacterium]